MSFGLQRAACNRNQPGNGGRTQWTNSYRHMSILLFPFESQQRWITVLQLQRVVGGVMTTLCSPMYTV